MRKNEHDTLEPTTMYVEIFYVMSKRNSIRWYCSLDTVWGVFQNIVPVVAWLSTGSIIEMNHVRIRAARRDRTQVPE